MITKVKDQIQTLINTANAATGNTDTDLTTAVGALVDGYGGVDYTRYSTTAQFTNLNLFEKSEIEILFDNGTTMASMFNQKVLNETVEHITVKCPNALRYVTAAFYVTTAETGGSDNTLRHITLYIDPSECASAGSMFAQLGALETIDGDPLDFSGATNAANFTTNCVALKDISFVKECIKASISFAHCSLLSDESIQSIIDGLADVTGQTAQTLTLHADVITKLTDEQIATVTSKNWNLA